MQNAITKICKMTSVIPLIELNNHQIAKPLAQTLLAGGLSTIEVTLRTPAAFKVLNEMAGVAESIGGVGTLIDPEDVQRAANAGAQFAVSPGVTEDLITACEKARLPLLPGASTPTEIMLLLQKGFLIQKYFPAEASGGYSRLQAISQVFPQISFFPTGGITEQNAANYLKLSNTICVGGSWVTPKKLVEAQDWNAIKKLANDAKNLS